MRPWQYVACLFNHCIMGINMTIMPLIRQRRSIRRFRSTPVEEEKIDLLVEAALRAPSSRALRPWSFVVITDRGLLSRLARLKASGSGFMKGAPLGIAVCGDPRKSDAWVEDASIAATFIQLAAESLGLASCWVHARRRRFDENTSSSDYVAGLLGVPDHLRILCVVAIGYAKHQKTPRPAQTLMFDRVYHDRHGNRRYP